MAVKQITISKFKGKHIILAMCGSIYLSVTQNWKGVTDIFNQYFWSLSVCSQLFKANKTYEFGLHKIRVCDYWKLCQDKV